MATISSATVEGNDAVCFTAGPEAAVVGAGTIHAYLAARRQHPKVVAGISLGALNAAAMQRAYRELQGSAGQTAPEQESARWTWFRHYLETLSDEPVSVLWDAIPDQSDFFADMIPIRDTSVPRHLVEEEREARRRQYLLVKLGRWLAKLPVSVGLVTGVVVNYVRLVEKYPFAQKAISFGALLAQLVNLVTRLIVYACLSPQFFPEHRFRGPSTGPSLPYRCRLPLVGWLNLVSWTLLLFVAPAALLAAYLTWTIPWEAAKVPAIVIGLVIVLLPLTAPVRRWLLQWRPFQKIVFPVLAGAAYAFSVLNLATISTAVVLLGVGLSRYPFENYSNDWLTAAAVALGVDVLIAGAFAPLVLLPETRRWLVERGFLREPLRRPLFGWPLLGFLWVHLLGFGTYLGLGLSLVLWTVHDKNLGPGVELALLGALWLLCVPVAPVIPAFGSVLLWRRMRQFGNARTGLRKVAAWAVSLLVCAVLLVLGIAACWGLLSVFGRFCVGAKFNPMLSAPALWKLFVVAALLLTTTWLVMLTVVFQPVLRRWLMTWILAKVGLQDSLIHDLYLRLKLLRLFDVAWTENKPKPAGPDDPLGDDPMPVVIVAASLQTLYEGGRPKLAYQLWARPEAPLLHALRAALAAAPIFAPVRITGAQLRWWLRDTVRNDPHNAVQFTRGIDLVDGGVIRQNPLPALYSFLRGVPRAAEMAANNDREHPAIHVVYGVPIEGRLVAAPNGREGEAADGAGFRNTIVDVGLASVRLSQRRDTQLEVMQSNVISRLESLIPATDVDWTLASHELYADEIAPEQDLAFGNALDPGRREILAGIAAGCRRSLETLYRHDLAAPDLACPTTNGSVACKDFLVSIGKIKGELDVPGLPEVCEPCTKRLRRPAQRPGREGGSTVSIEQHLSDGAQLCREHPQLTGERSRIVFVASGGVFRGAFHIGMLGALHTCGIRPDLVVGASVGTLMGGALAAMFGQKGNVLATLVDTFLRVDETVALTRTLKSAARELGIRGRAVRLSPSDVRRMLRRGARSDPGFAVTGAPTALTDALSDLLIIPQRQTAQIVADFIDGQVAGATQGLIHQLRTETIRRLDVEHAVLGTSLLEDVAFAILTDGTSAFRRQRQPFQSRGIAFYGTTTNLSTQSALLLGSPWLHPGAPYDFVEAALASSAFPGVFAPRPESAVFPGTGRVDTFFADGGMFDNLPFLPAIEILSRAQRGYRTLPRVQITQRDFMRQRLAHPDLLIAGALDPVAEVAEGARGPFDSLAAIRGRARSLQHNSKIRAFELASQRVYSQLLRLEASWPPTLDPSQLNLVDGAVNAAVVPVFPASADHLNGTFAFCRSAGLDRRRVQKSIADGCFQTFRGLAREQERANTAKPQELAQKPELLAAKSVKGLVDDRRIPEIRENADRPQSEDLCPYFTQAGQRFTCAFVGDDNATNASMRGVFTACSQDLAHRRPATAARSPR
jgi:predicted acylesterase/phospholipase RssA